MEPSAAPNSDMGTSAASLQMQQLLQRRDQLTVEIAEWRRRNSQSNPGAMMELRELNKELRDVERELANLLRVG